MVPPPVIVFVIQLSVCDAIDTIYAEVVFDTIAKLLTPLQNHVKRLTDTLINNYHLCHRKASLITWCHTPGCTHGMVVNSVRA